MLRTHKYIKIQFACLYFSKYPSQTRNEHAFTTFISFRAGIHPSNQNSNIHEGLIQRNTRNFHMVTQNGTVLPFQTHLYQADKKCIHIKDKSICYNKMLDQSFSRNLKSMELQKFKPEFKTSVQKRVRFSKAVQFDQIDPKSM